MSLGATDGALLGAPDGTSVGVRVGALVVGDALGRLVTVGGWVGALDVGEIEGVSVRNWTNVITPHTPQLAGHHW